MKGSELVAPNAVAALAGERGVLLLVQGPEGCQPPERNGGGTPASFYDARTHAITRVSGDIRLQWFAVASLADGRVMIAGGYDPKDAYQMPTRRTRIWDPRTRKWADGAPMSIGRSNLSLVTLADGRLMAAGGSVAADDEECEGCMTDTSTAELYDPGTNRWTPTSAVSLQMPDGGGPDQLGGVIALSGGQVFAIGVNDSAALYDPVTGTWAAVALQGAGSNAMALRDGTALSFGIGGFRANEDAAWFAARFDPRGSSSIVGYWSPAIGAATAVLADGRVVSVGGVVEDETGYLGKFLASAEVFDPDAGLLSEIASMPAVRGGSTATPLADGSVLVVGGVDVQETEPATDEEPGNDTPGCVSVAYRVMRWVP